MHNKKYAAITEFAKINNDDRDESIIVNEYFGDEPRLMIRDKEIHILCPKEMSIVQENGIADSIANGTIFDDASLLNDQADYMQRTILPMNAIANKHGIEPKKIRVLITGVMGRINDDGNIEISLNDMENGKNFLHDVTSGTGCEHVNKMCDHYLGIKNNTDRMEGHCSLPLDVRRDIYDLTKEIDSITDVSPEDEVTDEDFDPLGTKYDMNEIETLHESSEPMEEEDDEKDDIDESESESTEDTEDEETESEPEEDEEESETTDDDDEEEVEEDEDNEEEESEVEDDDSALDNESEEEDKKNKKSKKKKEDDEVEDDEIEEEEPEEDIDEEEDKPKKRSNKKKKDDDEEEEEEIDEEEIEEMYYDESFRDRHPKRLKPIPRDIISYITIEMNAIKDSNDQAMIAGYCSAKLELVDFYLNCIDTQDNRYIVPHNKQYLVQMQTELNDLLKRILQIKPINKFDRIWGGIL